MTVLKSEIVGNRFLGVVCVSLGLVASMNHLNENLGNAMAHWSERLIASHQENNCTDESGDEERQNLLYWNRMEVPPKVMSDMVESVLGAVFLDSELDLEVTDSVLQKIVFDQWGDRFDYLIRAGSVKDQHPLILLSTRMNELKCQGLTLE